MTNFNERKTERVAAQQAGAKFVFPVVEAKYDGKVVGVFDSKKDAEKFANENRGGMVGNTLAYQAWCNMQPRLSVKPNTYFNVVRVQK